MSFGMVCRGGGVPIPFNNNSYLRVVHLILFLLTLVSSGMSFFYCTWIISPVFLSYCWFGCGALFLGLIFGRIIVFIWRIILVGGHLMQNIGEIGGIWVYSTYVSNIFLMYHFVLWWFIRDSLWGVAFMIFCVIVFIASLSVYSIVGCESHYVLIGYHVLQVGMWW